MAVTMLFYAIIRRRDSVGAVTRNSHRNTLMRSVSFACCNTAASALKHVAAFCAMFAACRAAASALVMLSNTNWRSDQGTWLSRDPEAPLRDGGGSVER